MTLTAEAFRKIAHYDPETGDFTWLESITTRKAGTKAARRPYVQLKIRGQTYLGHRLAWLWVHGEWPANQIDHINGDPSDNRLVNLRQATPSQNSSNRPTHRDNKAGLKGVCVLPSGRFQATIMAKGKLHYLGSFDDAVSAHQAYCAAALRLHGEFAKVA